MEMETMKKILKAVEKSIHDLENKVDLTPQETRAALDGMQLRELLLCEIDNCKQAEQIGDEYSERSYSSHDVPYRRYNITAYRGRPTSVMYQDRSYGYMGNAYCDPYYDPYREPMYYGPESYGVQGRMPHGSVSTAGGYSRHSIGDRVVEKLEKMMDNTDSDYEREELHKFIRMVRQAAD